MAVAHLYGLKPVENETPRAPRMFVEPEDFASVAELARSIAGVERAHEIRACNGNRISGFGVRMLLGRRGRVTQHWRRNHITMRYENGWVRGFGVCQTGFGDTTPTSD
ncbi:MAG: hypothetical protein RL216_3150 [Pseudomonadota bacterium]|jgi:hypothetical protein